MNWFWLAVRLPEYEGHIEKYKFKRREMEMKLSEKQVIRLFYGKRNGRTKGLIHLNSSLIHGACLKGFCSSALIQI